MKVLAILPPFLPVDAIRQTVQQILPDIEVKTDADFEPLDAQVLIVTTFTRVDSALLDRVRGLKMIQVASTGYDNVLLEEVKKRGIAVCNIPTANKETVAEHVIALVLSIMKDIRFMDSEIRAGRWPMLSGTQELKGKIFGIIGMGAIGKKLAERLVPFEVELMYYDPRRLSPEEEETLGVEFSSLDELLKLSDAVSIHVPLTPETRAMISSDKLGLMKDRAILINTSRGEIVDEAALIEAAKKKSIRAGIDVFYREPPDFNSEMFSMDQFLFTPHIAGVSMESQQRFITETVANVLRYVQGLEPQFRVA
ncbi:MAG: 2-hydroxyacid dehydrogenase [Candidatus Thermoplasmatota archaeon]|jgi:phosphoglycerate dehydrogenase-like enzyme|nr:2-hydroxyacid dehydrogenase [Candidatus Thermoplasmatota archaeon]MCL5785246.1 2-hydroxyacid dehydrogenase [Candidatus Thermoplasmatota archaeon]